MDIDLRNLLVPVTIIPTMPTTADITRLASGWAKLKYLEDDNRIHCLKKSHLLVVIKNAGGCRTVVQKWVGFGWDWMDLRLWYRGIERFTMLITWHVWQDSPAKVENRCPVDPTLRTSKGYCLEGLRGIFSHIRGRKDFMESHLGNAFTSNQRDLKVFAHTNIRFQGISLKWKFYGLT